MQKELLSAYMDGEEVSAELTEQLCQDKDSQESWAAYHTVRAVMRKESPVLLGADFTAKMADLIELEEVKHVEITVSQPTPEEADSLPFVQKLKAFFAPMTQIAVAAGVCLVAVVGVQSFNAKNTSVTPENPVLQTLPFNSSVQEVSYNAPNFSFNTSSSYPAISNALTIICISWFLTAPEESSTPLQTISYW
mgnify:CR=1 FL=1